MGHRLELWHATWAEVRRSTDGSLARNTSAEPIRIHVQLRVVVHGPPGGIRLPRLLQMGRLSDRQRKRSCRRRLDRPQLLRPVLACSTGILNEVSYSYASIWGMPAEINRRRTSLVNAYCAGDSPLFGLVQDMQHRDVDVLMLYPLDLVAVDERFGSWMTQYGYANMITQAKLLEAARSQAMRSRWPDAASRRWPRCSSPSPPKCCWT